MMDNQKSEYISCTKWWILKKVLVRASILHVFVITSNESLHKYEWLDTEKIKAEVYKTHCHLERRKDQSKMHF